MGKQPAFQIYPGDWKRSVEVKMASLSTRGVWIEMLLSMWDAPERGKLKGTYEALASLIGCKIDEIKVAINEIKALQIGNVTHRNNMVTVINRRMYRKYLKDLNVRKQTRIRVQKHRETQKKRKCNAPVQAPSSSSIYSPPPNPPQGGNAKITKDEKIEKDTQEILDYINDKFNRKFENGSQISARLKEGGTLEQCKQIINTKAHDPYFQTNPHLFCPTTLFRKSHWDTYLNQKPSDFMSRDGPSPIAPYRPPELPTKDEKVSSEEIRKTIRSLKKGVLKK
jgi:uncharacterized phage protein (TIGR02220 family)